MSTRKALVERYIDGFRRGDHEQILSCLTDDILWEIHGHATVRGKADFASTIESDATPGRPTLMIDRLIEEGNSLVAVGSGSVALATGGRPSSSSPTSSPSPVTQLAASRPTRSTSADLASRPPSDLVRSRLARSIVDPAGCGRSGAGGVP